MKQKITKCPSPAYKPYTPDLATRIAAEKAAKEQPPLITMASNARQDVASMFGRKDGAIRHKK